MDRNSVIGFGLILALLIGYVVYNNQSQQKYLEQKRADSIAYAKAHPKPVIDSSKLALQVAADTVNDSALNAMPPRIPRARANHYARE